MSRRSTRLAYSTPTLWEVGCTLLVIALILAAVKGVWDVAVFAGEIVGDNVWW